MASPHPPNTQLTSLPVPQTPFLTGPQVASFPRVNIGTETNPQWVRRVYYTDCQRDKKAAVTLTSSHNHEM